MPTSLTDISDWLFLLLLLPAAIYYAITTIDYFKQKKVEQNKDRPTQITTVRISKIEQSEPSRHPPAILLVITTIPALILFAFGILVIYTWITGIIEFQIDIASILLLLLFIGLPIYIVIDLFIIQQKYNKRGKSYVAKEARATITNDTDTVFDACYDALYAMHAVIRIMRRPYLLEANIRNSIMTILIMQIENSKVSVYILSDSRWLTVKWDGGANQRNINDFLHELGRH